MTVAVASIGCTRKAESGFPAWPRLFELGGDYSLYLNYETCAYGDPSLLGVRSVVAGLMKEHPERKVSFDVWGWHTSYGYEWRTLPQYDQDQNRLKSIVIARNMCKMFAQEIGASHLLFIDADVIPPKDVISKLLEVGAPLVGGIVPGRGCHSHLKYIFGEQSDHDGLLVVNHGSCGCMMIERSVFNEVAFRYNETLSEDPAYSLDVRTIFGVPMLLRKDVVCEHVGDLKETEVAGY